MPPLEENATLLCGIKKSILNIPINLLAIIIKTNIELKYLN